MELNEIQENMFEIASYFDGFCDKNKLDYMICGGTLLGSVRHADFIPWDDDFDVLMPREDFNKLLLMWKENDKYSLITTEDKEYYKVGTPAKIYIKNTRVSEVGEVNDGMPEFNPYGIFIDIFPADKYPDTILGRVINKYWGKILLCKQFSMFPMKSRKLHFRLLLLPFKIVPSFLLKIITKKIINYFNKNKVNYKLGYGIDTTFDNLWLDDKKLFPSEKKYNIKNRLFNGPIDYDLYLSSRFGDYMIMPPKEKQAQHIIKVSKIIYENENVIKDR